VSIERKKAINFSPRKLYPAKLSFKLKEELFHEYSHV
jgi:hypothetical protein